MSELAGKSTTRKIAEEYSISLIEALDQLSAIKKWAQQANSWADYRREAAKEVLAILGEDATTPSWEDGCGTCMGSRAVEVLDPESREPMLEPCPECGTRC